MVRIKEQKKIVEISTDVVVIPLIRSMVRIIETIEGKFLLMAIGKITNESQTDKTPDEVLKQIKKMVNELT